jgi:hypothetical protein
MHSTPVVHIRDYARRYELAVRDQDVAPLRWIAFLLSPYANLMTLPSL